MTYPPRQPDPYEPGPQSGGFPRPGPGPQPNQQTAYGPPSGAFPQHGGFGQQGGYGQPPGGFGGSPGGGMPPRKKNTGLIIGLSVGAVLVVAAILFTGLAAPGWIFGDDSRDKASSSPKDIAQSIIGAINRDDGGSVDKYLCKDVSDVTTSLVHAPLPPGGMLAISGEPEIRGGSAIVKMALTGSGVADGTFDASFNKQKDTWCLKELSSEGRSGSDGAGSHSGSGGYSSGGY